jgi:hypothetical protein
MTAMLLVNVIHPMEYARILSKQMDTPAMTTILALMMTYASKETAMAQP